MAFCTVSDIESFLQIAVPAAKVASAQRACDEATAIIQGYCHQALEPVEDDEITVDCYGGTRIFLRELPVVEVSEVVEDGETLDEDDDYKLGEHGILHRIGGYWPRGIQIVTVTYTHGWDPIPDDLVAIATRMGARAYQAGLKVEELGGIPGVSAMSLGDYSISFGGEGGAAGEGTLGASAAPLLLRSEKDALDRKYRVKGA
ncbi:MAG TPA: hypothetical protein VM537_18875 [Anaerolineae bacterium]|nr:hypothetical protein [Anaerolineae bacterium]